MGVGQRHGAAVCVPEWELQLGIVGKRLGYGDRQPQWAPSLAHPSALTFATAPPAPALQVALAVAIIVVVAVKLDGVKLFSFDISFGDKEPAVAKAAPSCLLGTSVHSASLCTYTYITASVSLAASFLISLLQCCTCNLCGLGKVLDVFVAILGSIWWAVSAAVVQVHIDNAPAAGSNAVHNWRTATMAMMWTELALFVILTVAGTLRACRLFGCGHEEEEEVVVCTKV